MPTSTTITDSTSGAAILWCYNATTTCTPATAYTTAVYIDPASAVTLCANATASGYTQSSTRCATYTTGITPASSSTTAAAPTFSPVAGSYPGTRSVTISTATAGANIYYTLDGSTPDYTSTRYTGPITVSSNTTIQAIAGLVGSTTAPSESKSTAGWKKADCQSPGTPNCTSDNPGGTGVPSAVTNPALGNGSSDSGYTTSGCNPATGSSGPCMTFSQTPATSSQTNVLWARSGGSCDACTWLVADSMVYYPSTNKVGSTYLVTAYEHDLQIFDKTDNINFQFGMQCKKCDQPGAADWQFGGTGNTHWISTGVTQYFALDVWHHIVREDRRVASEITTKPCSAGGKSYPCQYYWRMILDGTSYNMQAPGMCPSRASGSGQTSGTTGCTITTDTLETGFGSNASDQYQIDSIETGAKSPVSMMVDNATFTALYDPSPVASAVYSVGNVVVATVDANGLVTGVAPGKANIQATVTGASVTGGKLSSQTTVTVSSTAVTLTSVSLATTGGASSITVGGTNQLIATCQYSDGSRTTCNTIDAHGNAVSGWGSSAASIATVNGGGLITGVAVGTTNLSATVAGITHSSLLSVAVARPTLESAYLSTPGSADSLIVGGTLQFSAKCVYPSATTDCTMADIYGNAVTSWNTSNTAVVTIGASGSATAGLASAVGPGTAQIQATISNTYSSPWVLTISGATVTLTNVSLESSGGVTSVALGATNQLHAICTYSDGSTTACNAADAHGTYVTAWASSNPSLATISASGLVSALASGMPTFTATAGGRTSAALPLTMSIIPSGTYTITIQGPVTITGKVQF